MKEVAQSYGGKVRFVSENWGDSNLAERYGIKKYPVIFVDDILIAQPDDFGWGGTKGRYKPWSEAANQAKFKKDITRMIELTLRDRSAMAKQYQIRSEVEGEITALPNFTLSDLQGARLSSADFPGQVVIVEFWATWCAPCRSTLNWLSTVKQRYGDRVTVLAVAIESEEAEVRQLAQSLKLPLKVALGSNEALAPFGTITSVPTMYVFDRQGKVASVFYGAAENLHDKAGRLFESLLK